MKKVKATPKHVAVASSSPPAWVAQVMKDFPRFEAHQESRGLHVQAKDYPEFGFTVPLQPQHKVNADNLIQQLRYYDAHDFNSPTLDHYVQMLAEAGKMGFVRQHAPQQTHLVSTMHNPDGPSLDVIVTGSPEQLIGAVRHNAISPGIDVMLRQLEEIEKLKPLGIRATSMKKEPHLRLEHRRLAGGCDNIIAHRYDKDLWLDHEGWQQLQQAVATVTHVRERHVADTGRLPAKPCERISAGAVRAPEKNQAVLVMDNAALVELCTARHQSKKDWTELLQETLALPSVGKIIIPDYIADFEMRGIVRHYNSQDNSVDVRAEEAERFHDNRRRFNDFIHNAVRRHIDKNGREVYLLEPGVSASQANPNIIIWETKLGREREEDIYQLAISGKFDEIAKTYRKNGDGNGATHLDKGEETIEQFTNEEMPWKSPVFIISSDYKYLNRTDNKHRTCQGTHKSYVSTPTYLMAELEARGAELTKKLNLKGSRAIDPIYDQIYAELHKQSIRVKEIDTAQAHTDAAHDDEETMLALIGNGLRLRGEKKPRKRSTLAAEPALPTPSSLELGSIVARDMVLSSHNPQTLAAQLGPLTPHMPPVTPKMIEGIIDGSLPLDHDHLYALLVLLVDNNPQIAENEKHQKSREMIDAYMALAREQENPVNRDESLRFGRFVFERMCESGNTDFIAFADRVREQALHHLRPAEEVTPAVIRAIVADEYVPSPGLALAIRHTLHLQNPQAFDEAYFNAQRAIGPAAPAVTLEQAKENVRRHFVRDGKPMTLPQIAEVANADGYNINRSREIGALLGKSTSLGNAMTKYFPQHQLQAVGENLAEWVRDHSAFKDRRHREADFRIDYETLMLKLEQADLKNRQSPC